MARILFAVPPLTGHVNPTLSVAAELELAGHEVRWAIHESVAKNLIPETSKIFSLPIDAGFVDALQEKSQRVRGLASIQFLYQDFCMPLARLTLEPLENLVKSYKPDVVLCDHQMIAGALVARKLNIPWFSLVTTTASILKLSHVDVVENWIVEQFRELQAYYGMQQVMDRPDFSPYGVIVFSSPELMGKAHELHPATYHFVGPAFSGRKHEIDFPWGELDPDRPKILVSLGTVSRDRGLRFYEVLIEALAGLPVQVIMVGPTELKAKAPSSFIIQSRVPQVDLLPHLSAVICHAGHNTVCESLSFGLPLIVAPIRDDQPVIAQQVVDAGAGIYLRYGKVSVAAVKAAVQRLLNEPQFRASAVELSRSFSRLGGGKMAADLIGKFVMRPVFE
jgi:MGT family glycosyltransferase